MCVRVMMAMFVLRAVFFGRCFAMRMLVGMRLVRIVSVAMRMVFQNYVDVILCVFRGNYANPGRTDPAPVNPFDLNLSINSECGYGLPKQLGVNSGMKQSAQHHVSTNTGKAIKIGNSHSFFAELQLRARSPAGSKTFMEPER